MLVEFLLTITLAAAIVGFGLIFFVKKETDQIEARKRLTGLEKFRSLALNSKNIKKVSASTGFSLFLLISALIINNSLITEKQNLNSQAAKGLNEVKGDIEAAPQICRLQAKTQTCTSVITWNTNNTGLARIVARSDRYPTKIIFSKELPLPSGSLKADIITAEGVIFALYTNERLIDTVSVKGQPSSSAF